MSAAPQTFTKTASTVRAVVNSNIEKRGQKAYQKTKFSKNPLHSKISK